MYRHLPSAHRRRARTMAHVHATPSAFARVASIRRRDANGRDASTSSSRALPPLRRSLRAAASSSDGDGTPDYAGDADAYIARHFVNLKNGVEAIPTLDALGIPHEYLRIQSTMCEVGDMEKVLLELDANFLVSAALGYSCVVYDYGSRDKKRGVPRALWYGLEFVRYALNVEWFGAPDRPPILRGKRVDQDFRRKLGGVSKSCKKRMRYYRQFIPPEVAARGAVRLVGVYQFTEHDDDAPFYAGVLRERHAAAVSAAEAEAPEAAAPPRIETEGDATRALEALGFRTYYGGDADAEWLDRECKRGAPAEVERTAASTRTG